MEIKIDTWDFNLDRCNNPIPFVTFTPSLDILELAKRNNDIIWVTIGGTGIEELDGHSFRGVLDKTMENNPCKTNFSSLPPKYMLTFEKAPYVPDAKSGTLYLNRPITVAPPTVLDPVESFEEVRDEGTLKQPSPDSLDTVSLLLLGATLAICFGIAVTLSSSEK